MSIKDFFTVPENEKISDRAFTRVLISSICGILLCMICLAGTTWAWFISNVEGPGSVMSIATISVDTSLLQGEEAILAAEDGSYTLPAGEYTLHVDVNNNATTTVPWVYVLLSVTEGDTESHHYWAFDTSPDEATVAITVDGAPVTLHLYTRWAQPEAEPITDSLSLCGGADTPLSTEE